MKEEDVLFMRRFATMAIGNMMEWFDFSSFGALVDIIAINFFPRDADASGIHTFAKAMVIFGVAFLMRPLGGVFMGWIGDTVGRKRALEISILLMMIPSFLIGCLPTFAQIGWCSTLLLVVLRCFQGLAAGGEIVGAFIFTMEAAKGKNLGFWGGSCKATGIFGNAMGVGLVAILRSTLSKQAMNSWGWRVPFWAGFVIGIFGLMARRSLTLEVHPHEINQENHSVAPLRAVLSLYKRNILQVIFAAALWGCGYYVSFVWMAYFLEKKELLGGVKNVWLLMFSANLALALLLPLGGSIGDYFQTNCTTFHASGWKLAMQLAALLMIITVIPAFMLIINADDFSVVLGLGLLTASVAIYGGNLPAFMNFQFPYELRYTGIGIAYNVSNAIFASTTSLIQTELVLMKLKGDRTHTGVFPLHDHRLRPAYYLMAISAISFVSLLFTTTTSHSSLTTREEAVALESYESVKVNAEQALGTNEKDFPNPHEDVENPMSLPILAVAVAIVPSVEKSKYRRDMM